MGGTVHVERELRNRKIDRLLGEGRYNQSEIADQVGVTRMTVNRRSRLHRPEGSPGIELVRAPAKRALDIAHRRCEECPNKANYDALGEAQKLYLASFNR